MSNYYVKTIERAAVPRSRRLREAGGYHPGGTSSPGGEYLPLTGGTITGDLRVRGNLIVGDVVIAMDPDGQLHVDRAIVSDGDLSAYGSSEEAGNPSTGGLDIDRLWDELGADDSSKVIDVSHLPELASLSGDLPWPRISGVPSWIGSSKPSYTWSEIAGKPDSFTPSAHSHPLSQISGLNSTWAGLLDDAPTAYVTRWPAFSEVTGKPSSLSGYGIEDGVNDVTITGAGNAVTTASVSGHMLTLTKGSSFSLSSHLHDSRYLMLDGGGTVDGSVKVTGSLTVGEAVITYSNGQLRISKTVISEGDLAAFGASSGGTSGGGLDVDRLWDELRADDSSKVIDVSHLPSDVVLQAELADTLSPYAKKTDLNSALADYAKSDWVTEQLSKYLLLTGGTMSGTLRINSTSEAYTQYLINGTKKAAHGYLPGKGSYIYNYSADKYLNITDSALLQFGDSTVWHSGNDGSGSGLDADLLDGTHKSGLLTAVTSTSAANLSVTVGGTVKSVADLYATFLEGKTLAETRRGMSFRTSSFTAAGWYRVYTSLSVNASYASEVILHIGRTYYSPQNENYTFSICVGYNGDISITQLSGATGGHLITKIRVVWDNSQIFHIDIYSAAGSSNNSYGVTGQGYGTFYAFTPNATIPSGYTSYEFTTVDGCKSDRGFTGTLSGNASSATKLATARTLWGKSFDGTANVSGSISSSYFHLSDDSSNPNLRFTVGGTKAYLQMTSAGISMDYGLSSDKMVYLSIAGNVGIGTKAPAHKLHVAGTGYFKDDLEVGGDLKIGDAVLSYQNGQLRISKTVVSEGDLAAFGAAAGSTSGGGLDVDRLWEELRADDSSKVIDESHLPLSVVLQDELTTTLSSYVKKTDFNSVIAGYLPLAGGTMSGDITMGTSHNIYGYNESSGSMLHFDGKRTVVGSCGAHSTAATHIRSKTGHATIGAGTTASYTMLDTGNYTSYVYSKPQADDRYFMLGRSVNKSVNSTYAGFIPPLVLAMMKGYGQIKDSEFESSVPIDKYDNNDSGKVTITRIADSTAGNSSGYVLKIHSSVSASPGGGGFTFQTVKAYKQTTCVFRAKIPAGYSIKFVTNSIGSGGGRVEWLTDNAGTGRWEWYACSVYFGSSPSSSHFYYLSTAADVDWYISFAQVYYNSSAAYAGVRTRYADALYSARTISLTGAVTGSASFDGSGNVSISTAYAAANISALDSRYVNVSGDTMTGPLTLNSDLNLSANSHIIFNRENFNYLSVPLNGTFAFAVGTTLNGANTVLGIDGGKVFPGYHNGTISLGSSSYRWSNVCSVAGNFSGDVSVSGDITGFASLLSKAGTGNRRTYISNSDFNHVAATTGWAFGLNVLTNDRSATLGTIAGAYGSGDNLSKYYYYGGSYTSPLMVIKPSGDVGIGTASPAYKFHVAGTGYFSSILTLGDSSGLDFVIGGTKRRAIYDDGTYAFYGDASYATGIRGSRIILQNAVGNTAVMIEDNDISFYGKLYIPSVDGNRKYYLRIA